mgnify:CR=1 FL=1
METPISQNTSNINVSNSNNENTLFPFSFISSMNSTNISSHNMANCVFFIPVFSNNSTTVSQGQGMLNSATQGPPAAPVGVRMVPLQLPSDFVSCLFLTQNQNSHKTTLSQHYVEIEYYNYDKNTDNEKTKKKCHQRSSSLFNNSNNTTTITTNSVPQSQISQHPTDTTIYFSWFFNFLHRSLIFSDDARSEFATFNRLSHRIYTQRYFLLPQT